MSPTISTRWYKILFAVLLLSSCVRPNRSSSQPGEIPDSLLKTDLSIFRETVEEAHPGIYWYNSKNELDHYFDSIRTTLNRPMSDIDFFRIMLNVVARLRCVHTSVSLSQERERAAASELRLLPFEVEINAQKAYVLQSYHDRQLAGSEIIAINEVPIGQVLQKMMDIIPSDGYNLTNKYRLLGNGMFRRAYSLLMEPSDSFTITYRNAPGNLAKFTVASTPPDFNMPIRAREEPIRWDFRDEDRTGLLIIKSFEMNSGVFVPRVDSFFAEMRHKNFDKLVIDLRDNGGGNNVNVTRLYSYLAGKPFYHLRKVEAITRNLTHRDYIINISEYDNFRNSIMQDSVLELDRRYPGRTLCQPVTRNHFGGKLALLVNGSTVSAASEFVALVKGNNRGIIVGEETGGCYYGSTGGSYLALLLPHSRLRVRIPTIRIFTAVPEDHQQQPPGRGVLPDLTIQDTREDIRTGRDRVLETALEKTRLN